MKRYVLVWALLAPTLWAWADRSIDETKPASGDGEITIKIVTGSLVIYGWDRDEIRVQGTLGEDVEEFIFEVDDDDAEIEVKLPKRRRGNVRGTSKLEISVPARSSVEASTVSAPISVSGVIGPDIELDAVSGRITVDDCRGELDVEVVSGAIQIDGNHETVNAESVSGRIEIRGVQREVKGETVSGGIEIYGGALEEVSLESVSGKILYEAGLAQGGELEIEAFNGGVEINFTSDVGGRYEIETFNGRISTNFGPDPQRKSRYGPGNELKFEHGDGDARIKVNSFNGAVSINIPR